MMKEMDEGGADNLVLTLELPVEVKMSSPFFTAGAGLRSPSADRCLLTDGAGLPYISGATLKGRARATLERILRNWQLAVCEPPRPEMVCPHHPHLAGEEEPYCLCCRVFGSPSRPGRVFFADLALDTYRQEVERWMVPQPGVAVDRYTGTAVAEKLYVTEVLRPPFEVHPAFKGSLVGTLNRQEWGLLILSLLLIDYLGGGKARGWGRVEVSCREPSVVNPRGERVKVEDLLEEVRKLAPV